MSLVLDTANKNIFDYWNRKLKGSWFRIPFLHLKKIEFKSFEQGCDYQLFDNIEILNEYIQKSDKKNHINENSSIAVIIPTYIRNKKQLKQLNRLIKRLLQQTIKESNIIVVDDCSPYQYSLPKEIKHIKLSLNQEPANARNIGIKEALKINAQIVVFTDTDCVPSFNWLQNIRNGFIQNQEAQILSGNTISYNKTLLGKYHTVNGTLNGRRFRNSDLLLYGPTCNLAVTKEVIEEIKFSTSFPIAAGEDVEFCFKSIKKGFNIFHIKDMIIYHDYGYSFFTPYRNLKKFKNQYLRYAKGENILLKIIPNYYSYLDKTEEITYYH